MDGLLADRIGLLRFTADKDWFDHVHGKMLPHPTSCLFGALVIEFRNTDRANQLETSSFDFELMQFMDRPYHVVEQSGHAPELLMYLSDAIERHTRGYTLAGTAVEDFPHVGDNALAVISIEANGQVGWTAVSVKRLRDIRQVVPEFRTTACEGDLKNRPECLCECVYLCQIQLANTPIIELPPKETMTAFRVAPMGDKEHHVGRKSDTDPEETRSGPQLVDEGVYHAALIV